MVKHLVAPRFAVTDLYQPEWGPLASSLASRAAELVTRQGKALSGAFHGMYEYSWVVRHITDI